MSVFEVLASSDYEGRQAAVRTVTVARERAKARFARFVESNGPEALAFVDDNIRDLAREAAEEHGGDAEQAYLAATAVLGARHAEDCNCGFCRKVFKKDDASADDEAADTDEKLGSMVKEAPGKEHMKGVSPKRNRQYEHIKEECLRDGGSEDHCKEMAARTVNKQRAEHGETKGSKWEVVAAEPTGPQQSGDHYQQEHTTVDAGGDASPVIDKSPSANEDGWKLPDIPEITREEDDTDNSERNPTKRVNIKGEYEWKPLNEDDPDGPAIIHNPQLTDADIDPDSPVRKRVDADAPIGGRSELESGDRTKTWTEQQAPAVTSAYQIVSTT
jgi:hypothetical protein